VWVWFTISVAIVVRAKLVERFQLYFFIKYQIIFPFIPQYQIPMQFTQNWAPQLMPAHTLQVQNNFNNFNLASLGTGQQYPPQQQQYPPQQYPPQQYPPQNQPPQFTPQQNQPPQFTPQQNQPPQFTPQQQPPQYPPQQNFGQ
jgi:hypothetical protein